MKYNAKEKFNNMKESYNNNLNNYIQFFGQLQHRIINSHCVNKPALLQSGFLEKLESIV